MDDPFGFAPTQDPKKQQSNLSAAATDCSTCGGDRFVVVAYRTDPPTAWMQEHGINARSTVPEVAPCPDCNAACNTEFNRSDGRRVIAPDLGLVRDRMERVRRESFARPGGGMPDWATRWARARAAGDKRWFPEMLAFFDARDHPPAAITDREHFVQEDEYLEGPTPKAVVLGDV